MKILKNIALWKKILAGVVVGLAIGIISPATANTLSPLGDVFLRMLRMLIVPLVFFSITSGICKMGDVKQLRTVGLLYSLWIVVSSAIAAAFGVIIAVALQLGKGTTEFLAHGQEVNTVSYSFINNVVSWFPTNIIEAFYNANMLQIIVFCLFFGVALLVLGEKVKSLVKGIDQASSAMLKITEFIMEFSPIGIMSLMATMVSTITGAMMKEILLFIVADAVCCFLVLIFVYLVLVKLASGINPFKFMKKITTPIIVAISTCSSAATLPVSIKVTDEELGIPENVYGFTLPLGNTCGMTGFALFVGMCCIFASNLYGFSITIGGIVQFVFLGIILSIGAAGVRGAGIVMSTVLLETLGMPLTIIPILAAIWPTIDPGHTVLNNAGDLCGTAIIAKRLGLMDMEVFEK